MRLFFILSSLLLISCGAQNNEPSYGKTTVRELIEVKGEPVQEEVIPVEDSKVLHYEDGEKYQVKSGVVTSGYFNPKSEQRTLIYWKHKFKNCDVKVLKLTEKVIGHEKPEFLMKCDELGTGVVYLEDSDMILRVIRYETI